MTYGQTWLSMRALQSCRDKAVGEARIAGDDQEPADVGQRSDDLDHAVGEIFLLQIAEGQHGY
jgi:hypothetical protein